MKVNKITLCNYRNFKTYELELGGQTTVLIGKNGMGKTNLIAALKQSLSFIFSKKSGEPQFEFIASSTSKVESFASTDPRYGVIDNHLLDKIMARSTNYIYPISINSWASLPNGNELKWEFRKESATAGLKDSLYVAANAQFWSYYLKNQVELPILAFFSDSYPHVKTNIGKNVQALLDSGNELPQNIAFYKWDEEKNCTEIWVQYFTMQWKNQKYREDKEKEAYLNLVIEKMVAFSKPIVEDLSLSELELESLEVEARGKHDVLIMVFKNGDRIPFEQLPQGFKRIFSIVFDLANRSYMLNRGCDPSGIVFIDELELHLHPSIAQEVLERFRIVFPKIQFIVSTHSPLVITNFNQDEQNKLYKLYKDNDEYKNESVGNLYGVDYNSGLRYSMDTPERETLVNELIKAYNYWKEADDVEMVSKLKKKIEEEIGINSKLCHSLFD